MTIISIIQRKQKFAFFGAGTCKKYHDHKLKMFSRENVINENKKSTLSMHTLTLMDFSFISMLMWTDKYLISFKVSLLMNFVNVFLPTDNCSNVQLDK